MVSTGKVTDSGGVEKLPIPRDAGNVWPTVTEVGKLGAGSTKTNALAGLATVTTMLSITASTPRKRRIFRSAPGRGAATVT